MIQSSEGKGTHFSVCFSCTINGQNFRPAVCYRLNSDLQKAVEGMREKELAHIYPTEVRFVSGVAYPIRKEAAPKAALSLSGSSPAGSNAQAPADSPKGKGSKSRKSVYTEQGGKDFF
jgi:hypothetical protein